MSIKKCLLCGCEVQAIGGTRYCSKCAEAARKSRYRARRSHVIAGQTQKLCEDIHNAIAAGISYGEYIGRTRAEGGRAYGNKW